MGAGENQCAVCGAPAASDPAAQRRIPVADRETIRFARAVLQRPFKYTVVLLVVNFFIFLLMWQSSGATFNDIWLFQNPVLVAYGAKLNQLIDQQHQWWRFVTPVFLHVGLLHLLVNMYSLWIVGPYVEKLYGSAKFVVIWVVTGIAGNVASYLSVVEPGTPVSQLGRFLFKPVDDPSAGASGALFGLVGVLFVFGIKYRHELPEGFKRAFGTGLLPMILLNLFIGYIGRGLFDNAAHLGGLVSGAALALVVGYRRPGERTSVAVTWWILQFAAIAVVIVSFVKVAQHFNDPTPVIPVAQPAANPPRKVPDFVIYAKAMNAGQEVFYEAVQGNSGNVDAAVQGLESAPPLDEKASELRARLKALVVDAQKLGSEAQSASAPPAVVQKRKSDLMATFVAWSREYNQWLKTTGKSYLSATDASTP